MTYLRNARAKLVLEFFSLPIFFHMFVKYAFDKKTFLIVLVHGVKRSGDYVLAITTTAPGTLSPFHRGWRFIVVLEHLEEATLHTSVSNR